MNANLRIRKQSMGKLSETSFPFPCELTDRELVLTVPVYAKVSIWETWRWVEIFNGANWSSLGVRPQSSDLQFRFPLHARLKVSCEGATWRIGMPEAPRLGTRSLGGFLRESRYFGVSAVTHVLVIAVLLFSAQRGLLQGGRLKKTSPEQDQAKKMAAISGAVTVPVSRPYEGITYTDYIRREEAAKREANPLLYLSKSLSKIPVSAGGHAVSTSMGQSSTGALSAVRPMLSDSALTSAVSRNKFTAPAATVQGEKLTETQKNALRQKFRDLQEDFRRIYSRLLSQDPSLTLTASYETRVTPSGYLELEDFRSRGTYKAATLQELKRQMSEVIRGVYVGPELNGLTLRAENVFAR